MVNEENLKKTMTFSEAIKELKVYAKKGEAEVKKRNEEEYQQIETSGENRLEIYNSGYTDGYNQAEKDKINEFLEKLEWIVKDFNEEEYRTCVIIKEYLLIKGRLK